MTKREILRELEDNGDFGFDMTWKKEDLERHLRESKEARTMTLEELVLKVMEGR